MHPRSQPQTPSGPPPLTPVPRRRGSYARAQCQRKRGARASEERGCWKDIRQRAARDARVMQSTLQSNADLFETGKREKRKMKRRKNEERNFCTSRGHFRKFVDSSALEETFSRLFHDKTGTLRTGFRGKIFSPRGCGNIRTADGLHAVDNRRRSASRLLRFQARSLLIVQCFASGLSLSLSLWNLGRGMNTSVLPRRLFSTENSNHARARARVRGFEIYTPLYNMNSTSVSPSSPGGYPCERNTFIGKDSRLRRPRYAMRQRARVRAGETNGERKRDMVAVISREIIYFHVFARARGEDTAPRLSKRACANIR